MDPEGSGKVEEMRAVAFLALLLTGLAPAAERVVLVEDFTNYQCSPCWNLEPTLNAFVESHLAAGDISVIRVHVNWPGPNDPIYLANPTEQNGRKSFYGINGVPTVKFDGVITGTSNLEGAYNTRAAVPSYLQILVCRNGTEQTGVISIGLVAEQDLGAEATMRLFCTIVEDDVPGSGYWAGSVFEQAFRDNIFGVTGPVVEFGPTYPDTVYFEAPYNTAGWNTANLQVATFVQEYSSAHKEVMNARYDNFLSLTTGTGEGSGNEGGTAISIDCNPCAGPFSGTVALPSGTGVLEVYDLSGRLVMSVEVADGGGFEGDLTSAGVYLLRLAGSDGTTAAGRLAVLR
jgi:hypothetical protein